MAHSVHCAVNRLSRMPLRQSVARNDGNPLNQVLRIYTRFVRLSLIDMSSYITEKKSLLLQHGCFYCFKKNLIYFDHLICFYVLYSFSHLATFCE